MIAADHFDANALQNVALDFFETYLWHAHFFYGLFIFMFLLFIYDLSNDHIRLYRHARRSDIITPLFTCIKIALGKIKHV
jgi:hypothetical protein